MDLDLITRTNAEYVDALYRQYLRDPHSVDPQWGLFFAGFDAGQRRGNGAGVATAPAAAAPQAIGIFDLIHSYRELGHLVATLDPLGGNQDTHPLLEPREFGFGDADLGRVVECPTFRGFSRGTLGDLLARLRATYCRTLGVEYMHIVDKGRRDWLKERMEPTANQPDLTPADRRYLLSLLTAAEGFEQFLHTKYVGQKRFSLEGGDVLIPMLATLIEAGGEAGVEEIVMGMPHRGRLNVLANILRKPYEMIFAEFEGTFLPADIQGDGDVKYHLGYARDHSTRTGRTVHVSLCFNPSHLEAVNPIVEGLVRAKQERRGDRERDRVVPVLMHGDAAFTGQGIVAEALALSGLDGFRTGGTVHIIVNNQIGFTTSPHDYRQSRYPTEVAKIIQAPVFHVNGDDPEAAVQAARLALAFRNAFKQNVIIDLVCYRRHGHNESDDPSFTQPRLTREIAAHPTVRQIYAERLVAEGAITAEEATRQTTELRELFDDALNYARDFMPRQQVFALGGWWQGMQWPGDDWSAQTAVPAQTLREIGRRVCDVPDGFAVHPRVQRLFAQRAAMLDGDGAIDWGCGEMLALGSLVLEGYNVRLSGQDSGRGTFSHRHAVLHDTETEARYVPLAHLAPTQGRCEIIDSMLSEEAVLGFEYGYSSADPQNLVLWEAQFGDFANGAQVIIDQFIASAESKWQRMSGIVLLLPHGYEGQGPEHSSARLERFLQLASESNMQVCNLTTPAQIFHVLRRQMHRTFRRPLVIMSPKSLLRHKLAVSPLRDLTDSGFQPVLGELDAIEPAGVRRVLFCSGKVYYDLLVARRERDIDDIAIIRVEQLYPFPDREVAGVLAQYPAASEVTWVQEEPWNMGAWHDVHRRLRRVAGDDRAIGYAGRPGAASPAVGAHKMHQRESAALIDNALRKTHARR